MVTSICCSWRGPKIGSQHHKRSHNACNSSSRCGLLTSLGSGMHVVHINTSRQRHIHISKQIFKKIFILHCISKKPNNFQCLGFLKGSSLQCNSSQAQFCIFTITSWVPKCWLWTLVVMMNLFLNSQLLTCKVSRLNRWFFGWLVGCFWFWLFCFVLCFQGKISLYSRLHWNFLCNTSWLQTQFCLTVLCWNHRSHL